MLTIYPKIQYNFNTQPVNTNNFQKNKPRRQKNLKLWNNPCDTVIPFASKTAEISPLNDPKFLTTLDKGLKSYCKEGITTEILLNKLKEATAHEEGRFEHCLTIAKTAKKLAKIHGVKPKKALLAGLLHDYAKGMPDEDLKIYATKLGLNASPEEMKKPSMLHAPIGAQLVKEEFGITDEEILSAIETHCRGSVSPREAPLKEIDKILIVADNIDPWKEGYKRDRILNVYETTKNINKAAAEYFRIKIEKSMTNFQPIGPTYYENYNSLVGQIKPAFNAD